MRGDLVFFVWLAGVAPALSVPWQTPLTTPTKKAILQLPSLSSPQPAVSLLVELSTPPQLFSSDTPIATVVGEKVAEVSFVSAFCVALNHHLQETLNLPPVPGRIPQIEITNEPKSPPLSLRFSDGLIIVVVRLGSDEEAPMQAAEAAAQAWLARVAVASGNGVARSEPWARQALACEAITRLRPAMNDYWYREGRRDIPSTLTDVIEGRAAPHEALLFWRALRREKNRKPTPSEILIASAQGYSARIRMKKYGSPDEWWIVNRMQLILSRTPSSLSMRESAELLDELTQFVFNIGKGDQLIAGGDLVKHRKLAAIAKSLEARLSVLRRELLRQNPVYHNAWRSFGTWLEAISTASEDELNRLWWQYEEDRLQSDRLRREIENALAAPILEGQ